MYFLIFISFLSILVIPSIDAGFEEDVLKEHNRLRDMHGSPALKLDNDLTKDAAAYAKEIADKDIMEHANVDDVGENLCWTTGSPLKCVQDWYDEIKDYNYKKPGYSSETGHFTALVWKATTHLGVGSATNANSKKVYVVARYKPQGNVVGEFRENVPPKKGGNSGSSANLNEFVIGFILIISGLLSKFLA